MRLLGKISVLLLFVAILAAQISLFFYKQQTDTLWWQQDQYHLYTQRLVARNTQRIEPNERRLYPGLPFLMAPLVAAKLNTFVIGLIVIVVTSLISTSLLLKITQSKLITVLALFLPPVVWEQFSKVSTESVVILGFLLAYWLMQKKKIMLAIFALVLASLVRPIALVGLVGLVVVGSWQKSPHLILKAIGGILSWLVLMAVTNWWLFASFDPFLQLKVYQSVAQATPPVWQIIVDLKLLLLNLSTSNLFIALSFLAYFAVAALFGWLSLKQIQNAWFVKNRDKAGSQMLLALWYTLGIIFIMAAGPTPFVPEFRRFLAVMLPLAILANQNWFKQHAQLSLAGLALSSSLVLI